MRSGLFSLLLVAFSLSLEQLTASQSPPFLSHILNSFPLSPHPPSTPPPSPSSPPSTIPLRSTLFRRALRTVELTHNMTQYTDIRRRLHQATGDSKYSLDLDECTAFILSTNKRAAVTVRNKDSIAYILRRALLPYSFIVFLSVHTLEEV